MAAKAKTPRISLISQIWKILICEISEIRGVFAFLFYEFNRLLRIQTNQISKDYRRTTLVGYL
jgi:hypothetical protein